MDSSLIPSTIHKVYIKEFKSHFRFNLRSTFMAIGRGKGWKFTSILFLDLLSGQAAAKNVKFLTKWSSIPSRFKIFHISGTGGPIFLIQRPTETLVKIRTIGRCARAIISLNILLNPSKLSRTTDSFDKETKNLVEENHKTVFNREANGVLHEYHLHWFNAGKWILYLGEYICFDKASFHFTNISFWL